MGRLSQASDNTEFAGFQHGCVGDPGPVCCTTWDSAGNGMQLEIMWQDAAGLHGATGGPLCQGVDLASQMEAVCWVRSG